MKTETETDKKIERIEKSLAYLYDPGTSFSNFKALKQLVSDVEYSERNAVLTPKEVSVEHSTQGPSLKKKIIFICGVTVSILIILMAIFSKQIWSVIIK